MIFMKLDFISQNEKAPLVNRPLQNQLKRLRVNRTSMANPYSDDGGFCGSDFTKIQMARKLTAGVIKWRALYESLQKITKNGLYVGHARAAR